MNDILVLHLKGIYYDQIARGEKTVEYRNMTDYWLAKDYQRKEAGSLLSRLSTQTNTTIGKKNQIYILRILIFLFGVKFMSEEEESESEEEEENEDDEE